MILQLVCALMLIESGGVPTAIGDDGLAIGTLQIHPIMVRERSAVAGTVGVLTNRLMRITYAS